MPRSPPAGSFEQNPFYARADIAERYDRSRAMPPDVERHWLELLARHMPFRPAVSVDVGCGTGRFTKILCSAFGGRVIGIDPSLPMLRRASKSLSGCPGVTLLQGRAEAIPVAPAAADLVLMSMSYHHVPDQSAALAGIRRTLRTEGIFCVRTSTRDALDSYLYQRFFPEARTLDERRFPLRDALREQVSRAGFRPRVAEIVRERVADDLLRYRDAIATRTHSDLQAISDTSFREGMARFWAWCDTQDTRKPVFHEVDLLTFSAE